MKVFASRMGFIGRLWIALAGIGAAALLFVALMFVQHRSWMETTAEHELFSNNVSMIREAVAKAHILAGEALATSRADLYGQSLSEIDKAISLSDEVGVHIKPDDSEFVSIIKAHTSQLGELKQSTTERWRLAGKEGYATAEIRFHNDFYKALKLSEEITAAMRSRTSSSIAKIEGRFRLKLAIWMAIVVGGLTALIVMARKREKVESV
ncbi:MAG: hypothetical protein HQK86_03685, partial [Nitrospinae bacterium]|nr:hypothetical protein [Nitrospinota bacterium]